MPITAIYAALLTPLFIFLSARVIGRRRDAKVPVGDGDDGALLRRMRVHANFAEYTPFALLCLLLAESLNAPLFVLHAAGLSLLAGRYMHAYGFSQTPDNFVFRVGGMLATFAAIGIAAAACLIIAALRFGGVN